MSVTSDSSTTSSGGFRLLALERLRPPLQGLFMHLLPPAETWGLSSSSGLDRHAATNQRYRPLQLLAPSRWCCNHSAVAFAAHPRSSAVWRGPASPWLRRQPVPQTCRVLLGVPFWHLDTGLILWTGGGCLIRATACRCTVLHAETYVGMSRRHTRSRHAATSGMSARSDTLTCSRPALAAWSLLRPELSSAVIPAAFLRSGRRCSSIR